MLNISSMELSLPGELFRSNPVPIKVKIASEKPLAMTDRDDHEQAEARLLRRRNKERFAQPLAMTA